MTGDTRGLVFSTICAAPGGAHLDTKWQQKPLSLKRSEDHPGHRPDCTTGGREQSSGFSVYCSVCWSACVGACPSARPRPQESPRVSACERLPFLSPWSLGRGCVHGPALLDPGLTSAPDMRELRDHPFLNPATQAPSPARRVWAPHTLPTHPPRDLVVRLKAHFSTRSEGVCPPHPTVCPPPRRLPLTPAPSLRRDPSSATAQVSPGAASPWSRHQGTRANKHRTASPVEREGAQQHRAFVWPLLGTGR